MIINEYLVLSVLWIVFCILHSVLLNPVVMDFFREKLKHRYCYYRLLYNIFAVITISPPFIYYVFLPSDMLWRWNGYWIIPQAVLLIIAGLLFFYGVLHYNWMEFIGLQQIKDKRLSECTIATNCDLVTGGILGITRHPLYLGVFIVLWARNIDTKALVINIILSLYLVIGTYLEEKKLVIMFGDKYREYQRQVSMFLPFKWRKSGIS